MNALDVARREKDSRTLKKLMKQRKEEEEKKRLTERYNNLVDVARKIFQEFDGINGLSARINVVSNWQNTCELEDKDGEVIAYAEVKWVTWDDPNVDYEMLHEDYTISWKVVSQETRHDGSCWHNVETSGHAFTEKELIDGFGKAMGEYV